MSIIWSCPSTQAGVCRQRKSKKQTRPMRLSGTHVLLTGTLARQSCKALPAGPLVLSCKHALPLMSPGSILCVCVASIEVVHNLLKHFAGTDELRRKEHQCTSWASLVFVRCHAEDDVLKVAHLQTKCAGATADAQGWPLPEPQHSIPQCGGQAWLAGGPAPL